MSIKAHKIKSAVFGATLSLLLAVVSFTGANAQSDCGNAVPNPLNPDCSPTATPISLGSLVNRFVGFVPIVITFAVIIAIGRSAFKIIMADDVEKRQEGFKGIINAAIGAAIFYSIWLILFLIEYFTGAQIIFFGS